jgi:hypothetical protein
MDIPCYLASFLVFPKDQNVNVIFTNANAFPA